MIETDCTVPLQLARISVSIFMASTIITGSPSLTVSPTATRTSMILPASGALISVPPPAGAGAGTRSQPDIPVSTGPVMRPETKKLFDEDECTYYTDADNAPAPAPPPPVQTPRPKVERRSVQRQDEARASRARSRARAQDDDSAHRPDGGRTPRARHDGGSARRHDEGRASREISRVPEKTRELYVDMTKAAQRAQGEKTTVGADMTMDAHRAPENELAAHRARRHGNTRDARQQVRGRRGHEAHEKTISS